MPGSCRWITYNHPRDAVLGVAVTLQVLGDCDKDTGRKSHVEYPVVLFAALLKLLQMLLELLEGIILVVLARDVCAETTELLQLLLEILCRRLDVGFDALEVFLMVHLCPRVSDDANVVREEAIAVLL
jgi:hypothetical protein